jgi:hypothetical protein
MRGTGNETNIAVENVGGAQKYATTTNTTIVTWPSTALSFGFI